MATKRRILVVSYGGTIVMVVDPERKVVKAAEKIDDIMRLLPDLKEIAEVDFTVLANKDSTNVGPGDWSSIAKHLVSVVDQYDGFVITHGTNTMAYTASALTLALGSGFNKPIVITGSQLPLSVFGNDARFNFENAVKTAVVAAEQQIAEVMIVFSDLVLRGGRALKVSESSFRAFQSPAFSEIGSITSTGVHFRPGARRAEWSHKIELRPEFDPHILNIDLIPGQLPEFYESIVLSSNCRGVILRSHGAGSVPTEGAFSFLPLIRKVVKENHKPLIVSTKFVGGNSFKELNDECAVLALEAGAIPSSDMTDVMTEVKLMWLLAQGCTNPDDVRRRLLTDENGEVTEIPF